jgi:hypothetical protein
MAFPMLCNFVLILFITSLLLTKKMEQKVLQKVIGNLLDKKLNPIIKKNLMT